MEKGRNLDREKYGVTGNGEKLLAGTGGNMKGANAKEEK